VLLILLFWQWRPLPGVVWEAEQPVVIYPAADGVVNVSRVAAAGREFGK